VELAVIFSKIAYVFHHILFEVLKNYKLTFSAVIAHFFTAL
jgi:hypothetical protein